MSHDMLCVNGDSPQMEFLHSTSSCNGMHVPVHSCLVSLNKVPFNNIQIFNLPSAVGIPKVWKNYIL